MSRSSRVLKLLAASTLVLGGAGLAYWYGVKTPATPIGPSSPILQVATPAQILEHARSQQGNLTLINFWASWCEPCKAEFPILIQASETYYAKGLRLIFVSVDDVGDFESAHRFLEKQKVNSLTFYKGPQSLNFVAEVLPQWSGAVPASVLLDSSLKVLDYWEGEVSATELHKRLLSHLTGEGQ